MRAVSMRKELSIEDPRLPWLPILDDISVGIESGWNGTFLNQSICAPSKGQKSLLLEVWVTRRNLSSYLRPPVGAEEGRNSRCPPHVCVRRGCPLGQSSTAILPVRYFFSSSLFAPQE